MSNMVVYRVERENGDGMYRLSDDDYESPFNDIFYEWLTVSSERVSEYFDVYSRAHITPQDDPILSSLFCGPMGRYYHFAFSSRDQLNAWICQQEWKAALRSKGYSVSLYSVDEGAYIIGESQAVFIKTAARLIERVDLMEF